MTDQDLLQQFLATRDEQAFAELVRRHIGLVYASARRQLKDPAAAEDVTQSVFVLLAQKARSIRSAASIPGWLLVTTRCVALNALRAQIRRQRHESEAAAMKQEQQSDDRAAWDSIGPLLDEGVATLRADDRDALTLRYFRDQQLIDVAQALGISEPAARKRVQRAVERLRQFFASRGIVTSADALTALLPAHALTPGPAVAFSAQVSQVALSTTQSIALKGGIILMAAKANLAVTCAAVALAVGVSGTAVYLLIQSEQRAIASPPATAPTSNPSETWRDRFNRIYSLNPGETLKHIPTPFIEERAQYIREEVKLPAPPGRSLPPPDMIVFEADGTTVKVKGIVFATQTLRTVLSPVVQLLPVQTDLSKELLDIPVSGDWIIRKDSTQAQRIDALCIALESVFGPGMTLKPKQFEREAIVVSGEFKPDPSTLVTTPNRGRVTLIRFTRNSTGQSPGGGSSAGKVSEMATSLGDALQMPVVLEADYSNQNVAWVQERSADFRQSNTPPDPAVIDEILATVSKETSLQFKRERRMVTLWQLEPK